MARLELLSRKKTAASPPQSPEEFLKRTVGNLNNLPTLPEVAAKAMEIVNDPNSSMRDLSDVIETDPALATRILKLANSPMFWCGKTIDGVNHAVVMLGMKECQNLIITVGMRSFFRAAKGPQKQNCETLWRHAFLTATICRKLNRAFQLGHDGEEFSCGLAHDLGRLLIAITAPDLFEQADPLDFQEGPAALVREQDALGTDHCSFGAWFADRNHLPGSLIGAIQFHHMPAEAQEHQALIALVATADHMANHLQRGEDPASYELGTNPGWEFLARDWDEEAKARFAEGVPQILSESLEVAQESF